MAHLEYCENYIPTRSTDYYGHVCATKQEASSRAVLTELREPTPDMIAAGKRYGILWGEPFPKCVERALDEYRAARAEAFPKRQQAMREAGKRHRQALVDQAVRKAGAFYGNQFKDWCRFCVQTDNIPDENIIRAIRSEFHKLSAQ